jgi:dipeptidyl aminopeptidase/acylaminoacyl peptidase
MEIQSTGFFNLKSLQTTIGRVVTVSFLFFVLVTCPSFGQANSKRLPTVDDYKLWGTMYMGQLSDKGNWVSYFVDYDEQPDSLFVKSTDGKREYKFGDTQTGAFFTEKRFAALKPGRSLHVLDLESGAESVVRDVEAYCFSSDLKYLVTFEKNGSESNVLFRNGKGEVMKRIADVEQFKADGVGRAVLCTTRKQDVDQVRLLSLDRLGDEAVLSQSGAGSFGQLVWQEKGEALAYLTYFDKTPKITQHVVYYNLRDKKVRTFTPDDSRGIPSDKIVGAGYVSQLTVSHDGMKVFFGLVDRQPSKAFSKDTVQIWNGTDTRIFPQRSMTLDYTIMPKMAVWKPFEDRFFPLASDERPLIFFDGNQDFAITYHPAGASKEFQLEPPVDMYITDLSSGQTTLWLKGQSLRLDEVSISPYGRFAAYFRGGQWYLYDFTKASHTKITDASMSRFRNRFELGNDQTYGIAGWAKDGRSVLIYDQYDIWSYVFKAKIAKRLTDSTANRCEYRVASIADPYVQNFDGLTDNGIDTDQGIIVVGSNFLESGYYRITPDGKQTPIISGKFRVSNMISAKNGSAHAFITERFDRPPDVRITTQKVVEPVRLFQSNAFYERFYWGHNEVVSYKNSKGELLSGILFYPAQYDASRKYPMVVHIYEEQLYQLHTYRNPTLNSSVAFNINHYLLNGYVVFFPDITYRLGDPGVSAADCVVSGTKRVLEMGKIDPKKVGLIGHSFGGYESYFIVTQTDIFAAAIAGAGVSDMRSFYLSVGLLGVPDIFRFENQQWRIGKSIFEDREAYERNSPVNFAANVTTPLLHWTGADDAVIDSYQAVGFYLALRRLNKTQQFLVYPNDAHALMRKEFQHDATVRAFEWFEYYLKGQRPAQWIVNGT